MADPIHFQQTSRTMHTSFSGIEIIRTFHARPYDSFESVIKALQGSVEDGKRTLPARDPYVKNCFCMETRVDFADGEAMASAPGLEEEPGFGDLLKKLETQKEKTQPGTAGAIITAHYRPLVTAWESSDPDNPDSKAFDWIDPQFTPGVRQQPWPDGLFIATRFLGNVVSDNVPSEVAAPLAIPITDFSIRRLLVDKVPWDKIEVAANAVNTDVFPKAETEPSGGLPAFKPRTLKFIGADVETMMDTRGKRWYEITYNFQWITLVADVLFDQENNLSTGAVTWNHVFMQPWWLGQGPTGWYEVSRGKQRFHGPFNLPVDIPGFGLQGGLLHNDIDFLPLFEL